MNIDIPGTRRRNMARTMTRTEQIDRLKAHGRIMEARRISRGLPPRPAYVPHAHYDKAKILEQIADLEYQLFLMEA